MALATHCPVPTLFSIDWEAEEAAEAAEEAAEAELVICLIHPIDGAGLDILSYPCLSTRPPELPRCITGFLRGHNDGAKTHHEFAHPIPAMNLVAHTGVEPE